MKRGRAVSVKERPIYDHCLRLFLTGRLHGFWAIEPDLWEIQHSPENPRLPRTFEDLKHTLRMIDPSGCVWDAKAVARPGKKDLERFVAGLLDTGVLHGHAAVEAARLIGRAASVDAA